MCTITLSYNEKDEIARQQLAVLLSTGIFKVCPHNDVYIEDSKVVVDIATESMSVEEAKSLTLKAIDLEYSLP